VAECCGAARHDELPPPMRRSRQEQRDAGPTRDTGLTAGSVRFRRRVCMQGNRPRACRLGAVGAGAEQKRRTGDAIRRGDPAGGYAGVPTVFLQHTRVSRGGLAREQVGPEVRREVSLANQTGSIISSHKSTTSSSSYFSSIAQHLEETPEPPSSLFDPCMPEHHRRGKSQLPPPQVTMRNIPPVILHPLQSPG
jgi:hypothetical protein